MKKKRIGDILVEDKLVSQEQIEKALKERQPNELIGELLVRLEYVTEGELINSLSKSTGVPQVILANVEFDPKVMELVSEQFCREHKIIPIRIDEDEIIYATSDPLDYLSSEELRFITNLRPVARLSIAKDIQTQIDKNYGFDSMLSELGVDDQDVLRSEETESIEGTPMIKLVNQVISSAITMGASDIHLDPEDAKLSVRYRIDGRLDLVRSFPKEIKSQMVSRLKVMADMDITETRVPQDGRILTKLQDRVIDLRVSSLPTVKGEKLVLRILEITKYVENISKLGLTEAEEAIVKEMILKPNGIILISGPTGSGKTTSLYAILNELNSEDVNIITVEDPVEIRTIGVNQVQVNSEIELTFANALRSILRQDPDIVMIGEIRDAETAEIAVRASLTGHLVLSSIHTNDAVKTITRMLDMGIQPYLLASSINGIIAQRLVRVLCPSCKVESALTEKEQELFQRQHVQVNKIYKHVGCSTCGNKGYIGRTAIYEILQLDDTLRVMISEQKSAYDIQKYAQEHGMLSVLQSGLMKVAEGVTSLEEVLSVASE